MGSKSSAFTVLVCSLVFNATTERSAHACGALVSNDKSVVAQSQQRVLISLRSDGTSNVVVQLGVPEASAPFGALTPVAGLPTLDPSPVDVAEIDGLDQATRPRVNGSDSGSTDSGSCGCGSTPTDDLAGGGKNLGGGVGVVQIVDIGPVTAAALSADSTAALTEWLSDNGFVIPTADQASVDAYVGPGKYFVAFKRSAQAEPGPSSVGVSFSVPGDQRGYPLRISRVGAAAQLGIQVFVAAPEVVSPTGSAPAGNFLTLTLADFSASALYDDYTQTLFTKIAEMGSKAFVIEGVFGTGSGWRQGLGPKLSAITETTQVLSRMATVVAPSMLTEDVSFSGNAPTSVPREVTALLLPIDGPGPGGGQHRDLYLAMSGLSFAAFGLRRKLRRLPRR
ncbi:MAG: DUF2330 domain-containing protein [Myxococcales bacterium]|nr:DUF2330 domain-containing protein [Myxococcales bacterium]